MAGYGYRESTSPFATLVWWADTDGDYTYTEAASEFWGFAFGRLADGTATATLIGPASAPRELTMVAGESHWGVELPPHVFVRRLDAKPLDELRDLPVVDGWFELAGVRFAVPDVDGLEPLLEQMATQGFLALEPAVQAALSGGDPGYSERNLRRLVTSAAGVGQSRIGQMQRARDAYRLLQSGRSLSDAATEAGYSDQAHMTRAFRDLAGRTPRQILHAEADPFDSRPV